MDRFAFIGLLGISDYFNCMWCETSHTFHYNWKQRCENLHTLTNDGFREVENDYIPCIYTYHFQHIYNYMAPQVF